jgi:TonB family protein
MKTLLVVLTFGCALVLSGCATTRNAATVGLDTSTIRPVLAESQLPPAAPGVYDLSAVDVMPAPIKAATVDALIQAFDRRLVALGSGAATVVFTISEKGQVSDVSVFSATDAAHAAAVTSIVKSWQFQPAEKDGRPVACRSSWGISLEFDASSSIADTRPDLRGSGPQSHYDRGDGY